MPGDPCSVLTRSEIAAVIGGQVGIGQRDPAIGETKRRICSYGVSNSVRTISVYLGQGQPRSGTGTNANGATIARTDASVSISAQYLFKMRPRKGGGSIVFSCTSS